MKNEIELLHDAKEILLYDSIDFSHARLISKSGKIDPILNIGDSKDFDKYVNKIKKTIKTDKPVIVTACDASHYGYVNFNASLYDIKYIKNNAKTWLQSTVSGDIWGRPVQIEHELDSTRTIGRVMAATPYVYNSKDNDIHKPSGHIEIVYYIPDKDAIEKIVDGRYTTVSVAAAASKDSVKCSICGNIVGSEDCEHWRGQMYRKDNGDKELCYWKFSTMTYREVSYVANPADYNAMHKKIALVTKEGIETIRDNVYNNELESNINKNYSLMSGVMDKNSIINLEDFSGQKCEASSIFISDSIKYSEVNIDSDSNNDITSDINNVENSTMGVNDKKGSRGGDALQDLPEEIKEHNKLAVLEILYDCIISDVTTVEQAVQIMYEKCGIYVPKKKQNKESVRDYIGEYLNSSDASLAPQNRERLPLHVFIGKNKTFPVLDKQHTEILTYLLDSYEGGANISRLQNGVRRKAKALNCDSSQRVDDKNITETRNSEEKPMKFEFDTEDALLASAPVQKVIDELKSSHEQEIDVLKDEFGKKEEQFKTIAADTIFSSWKKLSHPKYKAVEKAEDSEAKKKEILDELKKRSIDSLIDAISDYQELIRNLETVKDSDSNQKKLDAAIADKSNNDTVENVEDVKNSKDAEIQTDAGKNEGDTPKPLAENVSATDSSANQEDEAMISLSFIKKK